MELRPPLHLGVVAIEKGAFGSPSTMVANFTYFSILMETLLSLFFNLIKCLLNEGAHLLKCL